MDYIVVEICSQKQNDNKDATGQNEDGEVLQLASQNSITQLAKQK